MPRNPRATRARPISKTPCIGLKELTALTAKMAVTAGPIAGKTIKAAIPTKKLFANTPISGHKLMATAIDIGESNTICPMGLLRRIAVTIMSTSILPVAL